MREDIFKGDCYKVDTDEGTVYVPFREVKKKVEKIEEFQQFVGDSVFCEDASFELLKGVWMARLSTKGEHTEWTTHESYKTAQEHLQNLDFEEEAYNDKFQQDKYIQEDE